MYGLRIHVTANGFDGFEALQFSQDFDIDKIPGVYYHVGLFYFGVNGGGKILCGAGHMRVGQDNYSHSGTILFLP
jgi:hypothetical protein